jgi:hypothetical protein
MIAWPNCTIKPDVATPVMSCYSASFPQNWDDYHYKIAVLADRYFKGEKPILY